MFLFCASCDLRGPVACSNCTHFQNGEYDLYEHLILCDIVIRIVTDPENHFPKTTLSKSNILD